MKQDQAAFYMRASLGRGQSCTLTDPEMWSVSLEGQRAAGRRQVL